MKTKNFYNNCLFGILYLICRRKIDKVVLVSSNTKYFPYHFIGLNKSGNALHFATTLNGDEHAPFWFEGCFIGINKSSQQVMLEESKRLVHGVINPYFFLAICIILMALVSPIWCGCWGLYPVYRIIKDLSNVRI